MKCAVAVIRSSIGRAVARSNVPVNHDGTAGSYQEIVTRRGVLLSTYAFATRDPHGDTGCGSTVDVDSFHAAPGFSRSQRLPPITIPPAPSRIEYSSLFGASSFQVVTSVRPRPEERRSTKRTERSVRNVRVALERNAARAWAPRAPAAETQRSETPRRPDVTAKRVGFRTASVVV